MESRQDESDQLEAVETPASPSSAIAFSRFEFETGKGNDGTKILMVEWDNSWVRVGPTSSTGGDGSGCNRSRHGTGPWDDWTISWEGKTNDNVLEAHDTATKKGTTKRVYFLLPPGAHIPPLVTISHTVSKDSGVVLQTKPMPAIFPASLGHGHHDAGIRGVLHTIWARQRLADLEAEIEAEMKTNSESIGLQIAIKEHEWIAEHFGVGNPDRSKTCTPYLPSPQSPTSQAIPRSPVGGKLGEKLKGLKLATSPTDLAAAVQASKATTVCSSGGVASGGISRLSRLSTDSVADASSDPSTSMLHSLNAVIHGDQAANDEAADNNAANGEEELFALPLSPRSPEMAKSPFSLL